ncbi:excisionase family DNA-binding protein [Streptomyces sp. NPDC004111]|uniref:excisionase family DNA-binding protein n=1 Tax=Streptomyces sp. NPDC004111 TaxID=3364690 RepID=UPI0036B8F4DA
MTDQCWVVHHLDQAHNRVRLIGVMSVTVKISYSIPEAAEASSLSRSMLFDLIRAGELDSVKVRGRRLIPAEALHRLVSQTRDDCPNRRAA